MGYFAFGDAGAFIIADAPDHASASAVSLAAGASGGAHCETIVLMTPEVVDQTSKKSLRYTAPGPLARSAGLGGLLAKGSWPFSHLARGL